MNTHKKLKFLTSMSLFYLLPFNAFSSENPISWRLNQSLPNPIYIGVPYSVTYTLTNQLPLQLVNPLLVTIGVNTENEFSAIDNCSGALLYPQESCDVTIMITPLVAGEKEAQLFISNYDNNIVPLPPLITTATTTFGGMTSKLF